MSTAFEQPIELDIAAHNSQRCIVVLVHAAVLLPVPGLPLVVGSVIMLLVMISLIFHIRQLAKRPWRAMVLKSGGACMLLDRSAQTHPAQMLACTLSTAKVLILVVRVGGRDLNLPVFSWLQPEAYRQLRRYLLRYPPAITSAVNRSNDHRRGSGSVF